MDHKYSFTPLKWPSAPLPVLLLSLCWLPRTLEGRTALHEDNISMSINNLKPAQDDETTLLSSLLVSKHHCPVRTNQQWARSPVKCLCIRFLYTEITAFRSWIQWHWRKKEDSCLFLLFHLSHMGRMLSYSLQTAPAPKGGALGKWLLVSWLLVRTLRSESCLLDLHRPWVLAKFINYNNINSQ